jgi:hypothetical protein
MTSNGKQKALIALAVVAVVAGVLVAVTSGGGHAHSSGEHAQATRAAQAARRRTDVADVVARYLGMTRTQLRRELASGRTLADVLDTKSGKSEGGAVQALVDAQTVKIEARAAKLGLTKAQVDARIAAARKRAGARLRRLSIASITAGNRVVLMTSSRYLGIPAGQISEQQRAGHSLAQIADATTGKSAAGLIDAIVRSKQVAIAAAVHGGQLVPDRAHARLATLRPRVTAEVNRRPPVRG